MDTYVIRTLRIEDIDADPRRHAPTPVPGRADRKAALRFDTPLLAAEVLVGPPDARGRYRLITGHECIEKARAHGRCVLVAAVAGSAVAARRAWRRWAVHHAAA